jgi:hypothetical protein
MDVIWHRCWGQVDFTRLRHGLDSIGRPVASKPGQPIQGIFHSLAARALGANYVETTMAKSA